MGSLSGTGAGVTPVDRKGGKRRAEEEGTCDADPVAAPTGCA